MADEYKPTAKVTNLAIERDGTDFTISWKVPSSATSSSSKKRFTGIEVAFRLEIDRSVNSYVERVRNVSASTTSLDISLTTFGSAYARANLAPNGKAIDGVSVHVRGYHREGSETHYGDYTNWVSWWYEVPKAPKITLEFDYSDSQTLSANFKATDDDEAHYEWYDTLYRIQLIDEDGDTHKLATWTSTTNSNRTVTNSLTSYVSGLASGEYVTAIAQAICRGIHGNNPLKDDPVTKKLKIGLAAPCSITKVKLDAQVSGELIHVTTKFGAMTGYVKLQRRIGESGSWTDAGDAIDVTSSDATSIDLVDTYGSFEVDAGTYVYYRVASWSATIPSTVVYSEEFRADKLYKYVVSSDTSEATTAATCTIYSVDVDSVDGTATVIVAWADDGERVSNELSWSDNAHAWHSNEQPNTLEITWKRSTSLSGYAGSAKAFIVGLEEGVTYYFRGRTIAEDDDGNSVYSPYSDAVEGVWYSQPASVTLTAPEYVERGSDIELYWTVGSDNAQTTYGVYTTDGYWLGGGDSSLCYHVVDFDSLPDQSASSVKLRVKAGTGGKLTASNKAIVHFVDAPSCSVSASSTCTSQPYSFTVTTDDQGAFLLCTVYSRGIGEQADGEAVWTQRVIPSWSGSSTYTATVSVPYSKLIDGGRYTVSVRAVEPLMGLTSDVAEASFTVAWSHQAPAPSSSCKVTPAVDMRTATISLAQPSGYASGDVYDVYRQSGDGWELVASDVDTDGSVTDRYAPFGTDALSYRVVCRTADGDEEYADLPYTLDASVLRIDWGSEFIELPYNIDLDAAWSKGFEERAHIDGTTNGYWDGTVSRSRTAATVTLRGDTASAALLASLGNYAGACFVRTPTGLAYACNADVSHTESYDSGAVGVTLKLTAVKLPSEYMAGEAE